MVKLARELVRTVEKRQGLPSLETQKSPTAHQAVQFPPSDTSTFQKASEPFANATKPFHSGESPQPFDVKLKTSGSTRIRFYRDLVQQKDGLSRNPVYFH